MPTSIPPRSRTREAENTSHEIHRVIHEMVNHLTVINLCCFKFREAAGAQLPATSLCNIVEMETAVEQIAALLNDLTKIAVANPQGQVALDKCSTQSVSGSRCSNNVYPLFKL